VFNGGVVAALLVLVLAYLAGAIPFTNLAARWVRGVDLRTVGNGTVSGTGLYRVAGFVPLAFAGLLDVLKGAFGPLLAGSERPVLAAFAGGAAVCGHNWSVFLRGAGGRGVAPALGALLVQAWAGVLVLGMGLTLGSIPDEAGLGTFVALVLLVPALAVTSGGHAALAGLCVMVPMLVKRVTGNAPPDRDGRGRIVMSRLLYDHDGAPIE
jgi:glycerol-3-phosphate acyltransferase PlsY